MENLNNLPQPSNESPLLFQVPFYRRLHDAGKRSSSPKFEFEICFFTSCVSLGWWFNHICKVGLIIPTLQDYFVGGML